MRSITRLFVFLFFFLGSALASAAQKTAYINIMDLLEKFPEYQAAEKKIGDAFRAEQAKLKSKNGLIIEMQQQINKEANGWTKEYLVQKQQELEIAYKAFEEESKEAERKISAMNRSLLEPIQARAKEAAVSVAKARGYSALVDLSASDYLLYPEADNILPAVLKMLGVK